MENMTPLLYLGAIVLVVVIGFITSIIMASRYAREADGAWSQAALAEAEAAHPHK